MPVGRHLIVISSSVASVVYGFSRALRKWKTVTTDLTDPLTYKEDLRDIMALTINTEAAEAWLRDMISDVGADGAYHLLVEYEETIQKRIDRLRNTSGAFGRVAGDIEACEDALARIRWYRGHDLLSPIPC